jgi:hypothetical protein
VTKSHMLGGDDREPMTTNIWEGAADLVNGNMFTHNGRSLSLLHAI